MLELQHIHKMYNPGTINEICLFEDFNLKIEDGQFVSVVGSNGSGKTSMLNIICGSIPVDAGKILVNGVDISRQKDYIRHRRIGRVFQDPSKGIFAQQQRYFDISMGTGTMVIGLASVIIGISLLKKVSFIRVTTSVIIGSIIYKACVAIAIKLGMPSSDLKMITAVLFLVILVLGMDRKKRKKVA